MTSTARSAPLPAPPGVAAGAPGAGARPRLAGPTLTRRSALGAALAAGALLSTGGALPAVAEAVGGTAGAGGAAASAAEAAIRQQIAEIRASRGLPALARDHHLDLIAVRWSSRMAAAGGLSHNDHREAEYGWSLRRSGEVVGYARRTGADAAQLARTVVDAWMRSSGHRAVLLGSWTDLGVGCVIAADGRLYATAEVVDADLPAAAAEALATSRAHVPDATAPRIVLARTDQHPDALAAAGLLGPTAPLLLCRPDRPLPDAVVAEISRAATPATVVSLVGSGLPEVVAEQVRATGAQVRRVKGPSRYATAAAVADEVVQQRGAPPAVHLVRADQWADAVAVAGLAARDGSPVLLVDRDAIPAETGRWLAAHPEAERVVIGGPGAVGQAVVDAAGAWRCGGEDRVGTGLALLRIRWGRQHATAGDRFVITPGWTGDGWATALALAPVAAAADAPLLHSEAGVPPAVVQALADAGYGAAAPGVSIFSRHVPQAARDGYTAAIGG